MAHANAIISMELVLKELENGAAHRDPTLYFVTVFGEPSAARSCMKAAPAHVWNWQAGDVIDVT
jgi:hypothetical protein